VRAGTVEQLQSPFTTDFDTDVGKYLNGRTMEAVAAIIIENGEDWLGHPLPSLLSRSLSLPWQLDSHSLPDRRDQYVVGDGEIART
jgi:hypothetical protein